MYDKIKEAYRKYGTEGRIYFYFADDAQLKEIKNEASENRPRGVPNPKAMSQRKNSK